jgi:hypothetical protein
LEALLRDSPACLASLSGPDHMVTVTNQLFQQLVGQHRPLIGLRLREALPELLGQPIFALLDETYYTGAISHGHQAVKLLDSTRAAPPAGRYTSPFWPKPCEIRRVR